jgi:hypothetical protein
MTDDEKTRLGIGPVMLILLSLLVLIGIIQDLGISWAYNALWQRPAWRWELLLAMWACLNIGVLAPTVLRLHKMPKD